MSITAGGQPYDDGHEWVEWAGTDGKERKRWIFISQDIYRLLSIEPQPAGFYRVGLVRFLNNFRSGLSINVSLDPKNKKAELKPLQDAAGVWSAKVQKPIPGWRYLGFFQEMDRLVLFLPADRIDLAADWTSQIVTCHQRWRLNFGTAQPQLGAQMADFMSEPFYEY